MDRPINPLGPVRIVMGAADGWQRRHIWAGVPYAVVKKFGDDNANLVAVALAWYGFTAIFPLLLVVVTAFGFIGKQSIGTGIVNTLHEFPVIGSNFNPSGGNELHGSVPGLVIGLIGLVYGAQGVTQTAQTAMATVWNIPQVERTGFLPRHYLCHRRHAQLRDQGPGPGRAAHHQRRTLLRHLHLADRQGYRPARPSPRGNRRSSRV